MKILGNILWWIFGGLEAAVFDGIDDPDRPATPLRLQTVEQWGTPYG